MILLSPHPPGKTFGLTFVDDTDLSTKANTAPVYALLAECGFWGTKTVWPTRATRVSAHRRSLERESTQQAGDTLEDTEYVSWILELQSQGFEIALHGNASGNSRRDEIIRGLERFEQVIGARPTLNAFHQTNIENLYCGRDKLDGAVFKLIEKFTDHSEYEGHREGAPSFWGDIAYDTFRYVRLPFHTIDEINTLQVNPSMPFFDRTRPFIRRWFASSDGSDVLRFNRLLAPERVRKLADEKGICVIYTHFAKRFARPTADGYKLDADFEATVRRVTSDSRAWFATASTVLDRLRAIRSMHLQHQGLSLQVRNDGDIAVDSLVAEIPEGVTVRDCAGTVLNLSPRTAVLPRIDPGQTVHLQTNVPGSQTTLPSGDITRHERLSLEYLNYGGLVRGALRDRLFYAKRRWLQR